MKTMTNRYVPSWEKKYDPWDREPEYWENEEIESDNAKEKDEISLDEIAEADLLLAMLNERDEESINDFEQIADQFGAITYRIPYTLVFKRSQKRIS